MSSNTEHFKIEIDGLDDALNVVGFNSKEEMSCPFKFNIEVTSENNELEFTKIIGKSAKITQFGTDDELARHTHGIVNRIEQGEQGRRFTIYHVEVVPQLWLLSYRYDCRIFQNKSIKDIIVSVFDSADIPSDYYSFALQGSYEPTDYCVQYRESDLDFISRLMEEEGIYYFFEHNDNSHTMVISDNVSAHNDVIDPEVVYHTASTLSSENEQYIMQFRYAEAIQTGGVVFRDFNFKKPALTLESTVKAEQYSDLELYDYPAEFAKPQRGKQLATIKLEALQVAKNLSSGESNCRRFIPGHKFSLLEHPRESLNKEYLLLSVSQEVLQPQVLEEGAAGSGEKYVCQFECIPINTPFRSCNKVTSPTVEGVQTAIVVGPSNEEIYTDEHGRVKVQFHWDRQGKKNENSSCWIRVSQLWAGASWGAMFIPRIGQEVIVDFVEGDPDRPLITGRVYHGTNKPPYSLPAEKTKSTIKSNSSKGGGGSNELRFEDKSGSEELYLHAQKDWNIEVGHNKTQTIGHNETLKVASNRNKSVGASQSESIGANKTITVGKNHTETIAANSTVTVGANHTETINQNMTLSVNQNKTDTVAINSAETIGAAKELTIGGAYQVTVGGIMNETVAGVKAEETGGAKIEIVGAYKEEDVTGYKKTTVGEKMTYEIGEELEIINGASSLTMKKDGKIEISGTDLTFKTAAGAININMGGIIDIKGAMVKINS